MSGEELVEAAGSGTTINLSLISHTNAGKTTLARTLLERDVGEVRDAAHVTDIAAGYVLVQAGEDALMLWDTPGFGDTARLLSRLRNAGNPVGWFLTQVWDRWRERPLWSSQQAVRNARERADVILYLVNASEDPAAASYVALEMEVLAWIGKPVVLLLNQLGPPRADADAEVTIWRRHLGSVTVVKGALPLDAFARCWVQEGVLLDTVAPLLPEEKQPAMTRLAARWREENLACFTAAMAALAGPLAKAARDREPVSDSSDWKGRIGAVLARGTGDSPQVRAAMAQLAERLALGLRDSTDALIALQNLSGKASRQVLDRVAQDYAHDAKAPEGFAALLGGLATGAASGLAADMAAGGLTLGGGMIVGGILGALGAGGVARGINLARGEEGSSVRWSEAYLSGLIGASLLRYLAVAHFGRGRGEWEEGEHPPFWQDLVRAKVAGRAEVVRRLHAEARAMPLADLTAQFTVLMDEMTAELLAELYPAASSALITGGSIQPRS